MKTQKGFTLIELIIVIVVLGILAVTAAPQFFNFSSDARESTIKGLAGAVSGAKDIVYGKAAIEGIEADATGTTDGGVDVVYGYPAATAAGIMAALNVGSDFASLEIDGTETELTTSANGDLVIYPTDKPINDTADTECYVVYTPAADASTPPVVTAVTGGC
ncbi:type II secretion system protein [Pseudidiomarina marina]|uniref:type II secretion system protein n=1 Tax=Pseudidiomarina marina TaxID=502366 RepID=UPI00384F762D